MAGETIEAAVRRKTARRMRALGYTVGDVAEVFEVSKNTITEWTKGFDPKEDRVRKEGEVS